MSSPEQPLDGAALQRALRGRTLGRAIVVLPETTSTNDVLRELATAGAAEGLVVFSETQTAGRGQYGRQWDSPRGLGLWFSILLRPQIELRESARLTGWLAATIARTLVQHLHISAEVKPPNDVVIDGFKVAGVLVELRRERDACLAVAGVGVNVNQAQFPAQIQDTATSLRLVCGRTIDRTALAISLLEALDAAYSETITRRTPLPDCSATHGSLAEQFPKA
jgi:BirA family biotin operon repressor/biotin-[acetyl-CoA-carboxylase] ligase